MATSVGGEAERCVGNAPQIDTRTGRRRPQQVFGLEPSTVAAVDGDLARGSEVETGGPVRPERKLAAKFRRFNRGDAERHASGNDAGARLEQPRAHVGDRFHEAGFEPKLSDLVGDEDVGAFRQFGHRRVGMHELDAVLEAVGVRQGAGEPDDRAGFDAVDARRAGAAGKQAKNAGARCQVDHHVARADNGGDRASEGVNPRSIGDELAMRVQLDRHVRLQTALSLGGERRAVADRTVAGLGQLRDVAVFGDDRCRVGLLGAASRPPLIRRWLFAFLFH